MNKAKPPSFTIARSLFILLLVGNACATRAPYNGPVFSEKSIKETFSPILEFMNYKPGMSFADVGAGSGAITVMMGTLMSNSTIYIQDIDTKILEQDNVNKIIAYYSEKSNQNLQKKNQFSIVHGDANHSNLPDGSLDLIYTNATLHVFDSPDSMFIDLRKKLKPSGAIFIRDDFKNQNGKREFCGDSSCGKPLRSED